jgi:hypothetical protein
MSIAASSALSGSNFVPLYRAAAVTPAPATAPTAGATQGSGAPAPATSTPKQTQPLLLVPTVPLTAAVLAELVGRQLSLNGAPTG